MSVASRRPASAERTLANVWASAKKAGLWYDAEKESDGVALEEVEWFFGVCIEGMEIDGRHALGMYVGKLMPLSREAKWWTRPLVGEVMLQLKRSRCGDKWDAMQLLLDVFEAAHELGKLCSPPKSESWAVP